MLLGRVIAFKIEPCISVQSYYANAQGIGTLYCNFRKADVYMMGRTDIMTCGMHQLPRKRFFKPFLGYPILIIKHDSIQPRKISNLALKGSLYAF